MYAEIARAVYVPNLAPHFHIIPWPQRFLDRDGFIAGYKTAAAATDNFSNAHADAVATAIKADPRALRVFRLIIGYTPRELGEALRAFENVSVRIETLEDSKTISSRAEAALPALGRLISNIVSGANGYDVSDDLRERGFLGKTDKPDTRDGWSTVNQFATQGVPYVELLYQRWYGGAFRQLQDAGGRLKGDLLEDATHVLFEENGVPFVRTLPGTQATAGETFGVTVQPAPDFIIHDGTTPEDYSNARALQTGARPATKPAVSDPCDGKPTGWVGSRCSPFSRATGGAG